MCHSIPVEIKDYLLDSVSSTMCVGNQTQVIWIGGRRFYLYSSGFSGGLSHSVGLQCINVYYRVINGIQCIQCILHSTYVYTKEF